MPKPTAVLILTAALLAGAPAIARSALSPEDRIAKIVAGRTAGEPVNCISQREINSTEIVDRTAIVYKMNNGTIYVNRPASGAAFLDRDDVLVTKTHSSQLCDIDVVRLVDSGTKMSTGSVGLGKFVPYPRVRKRAGY